MTASKTIKSSTLVSLVIAAMFANSMRMDACSVFAPNHSTMMAANYDWTVNGGLVFTNARGLSKRAFLVAESPGVIPAAWTSRYASVTLSQWGREFPMQGMNEAGLAGVVLNAPASYPAVTAKTKVITEMQWLQYQLDRYSTVRELALHLADFGFQKISAPLHFFFCDTTSDCGLVEFINGKGEIHRGARLELRAITNSPYETSLASWISYLKNHPGPQAGGDLPAGYPSLNRVVRAGWFAQDSKQNDSVALNHLQNLAGQGWTNWHTVFKTSQRELFVTPLKSTTTYKIGYRDFAVSCGTAEKMLKIDESGISKWLPYSAKDAADQLARAAKPIPGFPEELRNRMIRYGSEAKCMLNN